MAEAGKKKIHTRQRGLSVHVVQAQRLDATYKEVAKEVTKEPIKEEVAKKVAEPKKTAKPKAVKEVAKKVVEPEKIAELETAKASSEPASDGFETLKINAISKPSSRIMVRDVERTYRATAIKPQAKKVQPEVRREELPPVFKTTRRTNGYSAPRPKLSAKEIKEQEIKRAVKKAEKLPSFDVAPKTPKNLGWTRILLAVACTATALFAVVYFVNLASTDMSIKVAAMQSGIEASYPSYIPRGYDLSDVTSMSGKVIMHFKSADEGEFEITEENSSWDSSALLNGYVKENYNDNYVVVREQGLTLYMGDNWEAWVNGGTLYKLSVISGSLTKKQMKSIAVSL